RVTNKCFPSLIGGYLFGFSTYVIGQLSGHGHFAFLALVPAAGPLVLRPPDNHIPALGVVAALRGVLVLQFARSHEVFPPLAFFGAVVWGIAAVSIPSARQRLMSTGILILAAFSVSSVVLSPYLHSMFAHDTPKNPIQDPRVHSADLLNFFVPTPLTLIGGE